MTTYTISNQCAKCQHLFDGIVIFDNKIGCLAFPRGIPIDIATDEFDHTNKHDGDNGYRFKEIVNEAS